MSQTQKPIIAATAKRIDPPWNDSGRKPAQTFVVYLVHRDGTRDMKYVSITGKR